MSCVRQLLIFILVPPLQLQQLCEQTVALKAAEAEVLKMMRGRFLTWSCSIAEVLKRFWCCGAFFFPPRLLLCSPAFSEVGLDWFPDPPLFYKSCCWGALGSGAGSGLCAEGCG